MKIRQGDAYDIEITLTTDEGDPITPEIVEKVVVTLGHLKKSYPDGGLTYDSVWVFPLTQEETLKLPAVNGLEARAKFTDGTAAGATIGVVKVERAQNGEVI